MKKTFYLFCAIAMLTGCKQENRKEEPAVPNVKIAKAQNVKTTGSLHYSGTVQPSQSIPLLFQTSGTVQQVFVNAGDAVHKGQLLATVDKTDAQSMYEMALAKYKQAKDAYNRLKEVHDSGSLVEIKWVEMESNLQQAESSIALAKNNLNKCNLHSPDFGIIGSRNVEPGMSSLANLKAPFELIKIENVFVKISVPENEIGKMHKGLKASIKVSALDNQVFEGLVTNVGVVADQLSRTYEVKITVKNPDLLLKPGMVCDVNLDMIADKQILVVPCQSVNKDNDNNCFVFVADTEKKIVRKRIIGIGDYQNNEIEVISGLSEGEKIVCEGMQKLSDNCKIKF